MSNRTDTASMTQITTEAMTQLQKRARAVTVLYRIADRKRAILHRACNDQHLQDQYIKAEAGDGFDALLRALFFDLVRDAVAFTLDRDPRSASLHNVLEELTDNDVRTGVKQQWPGPMNEDQLFEEYYARLTAAAPSVLNGALAKKLRKARNQCVAHYELTKPGEDPDLIDPAQIGLKWGDIDEYFDQVEPLIYDAELVVSNVGNAFDNMRRTHAEIAEQFWAVSKRPS